MIVTNLNDTERTYAFVRRQDPENADGPFEVCSICRYPAPLCDYNTAPVRIEGPPEYFCALCANVRKLAAHPESKAVIEVILNVGNTILAAVGAFGPLPLPDPNCEDDDIVARSHALMERFKKRNAHLFEEEVNADISAAIAEVRAQKETECS